MLNEEQKKIKLINKAYDSLYDLNSKYRLFQEQLDFILNYMENEGYKLHINKKDKCIFKKKIDYDRNNLKQKERDLFNNTLGGLN
jgi:hypothetical protein